MIHLINKYFWFLFFFSFILHSQTIKKVEISGSNRIDKNQLISILQSQKSLTDSVIVTLKNRVNSLLADEGFYKSKVSFDSTGLKKNGTLSVNISEGEPTYIKEITVESADSNDNAVVDGYFKYLSGKIFIRNDVEKIFYEILSGYEDKGFPFASIEISGMVFSADSMNQSNDVVLHLQFKKDEKSFIDKILVEGNTKTKDYVIKRNIRIKEGDEFSTQKIKTIPEILNRMKFFEPAESPQYYFDTENKGVLKIFVKEKVTNNFDGILGYVPAVKNKSKGYFTGFINVGLRNIFGTERSGLIKWQKDGLLSQELEINYTEPWLFDLPVNVTFFVWQRKQDSTYVQRKYESKIEYLLSNQISTSVFIGTESTIPSEPDNKGFTVFHSTSLILGANLRYDTRDDAYSPAKGFLFATTYKLYQKKITGPEQFLSLAEDQKVKQQKIEFDLSYFQTTFTSQVFAASFHGRELKGNFHEISDLYKLGGAFTLRGYIENQFWGNRIFWSNFEYRYLIEKRSFVFVFFDEGYFLLSKNNMERKKDLSGFKSGYGFGLNLETGIGVLGVSFALSKGDTFGEGKLHFGIINEF
jgi:outer membrane protein insertion porin family